MIKRLTLCFMAVMATATLFSQHLPDGDWNGELSLPGASLRLVFHFTRDSEGELHVSIDSPDQGAYGIAGEATHEGDRVSVVVPMIGMVYVGTLSDDGMTIKGEFRQMGHSLPLDMKRVLEAENTVPATSPGEGYDEREVTVPCRDGVTLTGTVTLPTSGQAPFPALVFITGSGAQDRDETLFGQKPFAVIARHLADNGYASLRCDDRGAGGSTPLTGNETSRDFADDAREMLAFLASLTSIDSSRVGFLGHSEGGLIALLNADNNVLPHPAFVITLAAPTVKGSAMMRQQNIDIAAISGQTLGDDVLNALDETYRLLESERSADDMRPQLLPLLAVAMGAVPEAAISRTADTMLTPWYREMLRLDPTDAMRRISCPVLALYGEYDVQVNATLCGSAATAGMPGATVTILPACNHLFQRCNSRAVSLNYAALGPVDNVMLDTITNFLNNLK